MNSIHRIRNSDSAIFMFYPDQGELKIPVEIEWKNIAAMWLFRN